MPVDRTDPYAVLGLTPEATQEQIRRAYRTLMRQHHPDTRPRGNPADTATTSNMTLQQVIAAYAILGDPGRRAGYDHRTIAHQTSTAPRIRPVLRFPQTAADQPPIQAGPVHWDPNPR